MAIHHGIYWKRSSAGELPVFRCGILRIFKALKTGSFLTDPDKHRQAAQLEDHCRKLWLRFVFVLQELNGLMPALVHCYIADHLVPFASDALHYKSGCLADHVLTSLNTLADDVAIGVVLATGFVPSKSQWAIDSMGKLRRQEVRNAPAFAPVKSLLDETHTPGSWWDLGFAPGKGRQLMVHNHHLVNFELSSPPGGPMEVRAVVTSPSAQNSYACHDFFGLLRAILSGLFGWLDRLEAALVSHLQQQAVGWSPPAMFQFLLPVGYPPGITRYDPRYFPIPVCDDSDELPVSVSVPLAAPKKQRNFWCQAASHFKKWVRVLHDLTAATRKPGG
jgi:hypothetical protein